jgi:hypothetical protein
MPYLPYGSGGRLVGHPPKNAFPRRGLGGLLDTGTTREIDGRPIMFEYRTCVRYMAIVIRGHMVCQRLFRFGGDG